MYRVDPYAARRLLLEETYEYFDASCRGPVRDLRDNANQLVPGRGDFDPTVVFIGEAPGAAEDRLGLPFVGASGRFLAELISVAGLEQNEVWITNAVKYRPEGNRSPDKEEIADSRDLLRREMALVRPKIPEVYVGLGRVACYAIASRDISVGREHGSCVKLTSGRLFVSYHPAAGLRSKMIRKQMEQDFFTLGEELDKQR